MFGTMYVHVYVVNNYVNLPVQYLFPRDTAGRMKEEALRNDIALHKQASFTVMISARLPLITHTEWLISVYEGREDETEMIHAPRIGNLSSLVGNNLHFILFIRKQFKEERKILLRIYGNLEISEIYKIYLFLCLDSYKE